MKKALSRSPMKPLENIISYLKEMICSAYDDFILKLLYGKRRDALFYFQSLHEEKISSVLMTYRNEVISEFLNTRNF